MRAESYRLGVLPWSEAMKSELHHIESDVEAFTWAAGCVLASYVERSGVTNWLHTSFVRAVLALLVFSQVLNFSLRLFSPLRIACTISGSRNLWDGARRVTIIAASSP